MEIIVFEGLFYWRGNATTFLKQPVTFQNVATCVQTIIPVMSKKKAWDLTIKVDKSGFAEVWRGNVE